MRIKLKYAWVLLLLVTTISLMFSGLFRNPYSSGLKAQDKGDWVKASKHFSQAFTKDPSPMTCLAFTQALIYLEDYNSAKDVISQGYVRFSGEEKHQFAGDLLAWIAETGLEIDGRLNPVLDFAEFLMPYTELLVSSGALDTAFAYLEGKPSPAMPTTSFTANSMAHAAETLALAYFQQGNWYRLSLILDFIEDDWLSKEALARIFNNAAESDYNQLSELIQEHKHQLSPAKAHYLINEAISQDRGELLAYVIYLQPEALLTNTNFNRVAETIRLLNEAQPLVANPQWASGFNELHRKILQGCIVEIKYTGEYLVRRLPYADTPLYRAVEADLKARFSQYAYSLQVGNLTPLDKQSVEGNITQLRLAPKGNKVLIWSALGENQEVSLYDFESESRRDLIQQHFVWGRWSLDSSKFALDIRTKGEIEDWQFIFYDAGGNPLKEVVVHHEPFIYQLLSWADSERIYGFEPRFEDNIYVSVNGVDSAPNHQYSFSPNIISRAPGNLFEVINAKEAWWAVPFEGKSILIRVDGNYNILKAIPGLWTAGQLNTLSIGDSILVWYENGEIHRAKYK